jgi:predicted ABC-type ATPase
MSPALYIIAGPNGAGKTTFAKEFLQNYAACRNFINADLIAQGMSPFSPETAAFQAGRVMLGEIHSLAKRRLDFAFETTLSGRTHVHLIRQLGNQGYAAHFFFLWVPTVDLALSRVRRGYRRAAMMCPQRSSAGGLLARSGTSSFSIVA